MVVFTEITNNNGPINKRIEADGSKSAAASVYDAVGKTVRLELKDFPNYIEGLKDDQALVLGICGESEFELGLAGGSKIARTKEFFKYCNSDSVGLMLFDIDGGSAHGPWKDAEINGFIEKLEGILNGCLIGHEGLEREKLCRFERDSCTAGVVKDGVRLGNGKHIYFPVRNPNEKLLELIFQWSWLNGFGTHLVSRSGSVLLRSILDIAVKSPERLVFESDCSVADGMEVVTRECKYIPGGVIDCELALLALEEAIDNEYVKKSRAYVAEIEKSPEVQRIRRQYEEAEVARLMGDKAMSKRDARNVVYNRQKGVLLSSDFIVLNDMSEVAVYDILVDRDSWHGRSDIRPPLEPEYGVSKAKIFVNDVSVKLNCFAHGGQIFDLHFDEAGIKQWVSEATDDELEDNFADFLAIADVDGAAAEKIYKEVGKRIGVTVTAVKKDVKNKVVRKEDEPDENVGEDGGGEGLSKNATHYDIASDIADKFKEGYKVFGGVFYAYDKTIWKGKSANHMLKMVAANYGHCLNCTTQPKYNQVLRTLLEIVAPQENSENWPCKPGIPCSNNFWLFEDGEIGPVGYDKGIGARYKLGFEPDFDMPTPMWDKVLKGVVNVECLQKLLGLALCGVLTPLLQKVGVFKGVGGSGKSTVSHVLRAMLPGNRISTMSMGQMNVPERCTVLVDSVLTLVAEENRSEKKIVNIDGFKRITGGDAVSCRYLFRDPFTFIPQTSVLISMNEWPNLTSFGSDVARRLDSFIVKFEQAYSDDEKIDRIDKIIVERELPGVLAWMIEGIRKWSEDKSDDLISKELFREWQKSTNSIEEFITDMCVVGGRVEVIRSALYDAYVRYCQSGELSRIGRNEFYDEVRKYKMISDKSKTDNEYFVGISLKS